MQYSEIEFGNASAEVESASSPRLLLDGYFDPANVTAIACESDRFLFLGYKGSGKTALGQRLQLLSQREPELFVRNVFLADLPYPLFLKLAGGDDESSHSVAWAWILLAALLDSFEQDLGADRDPEYQRAVLAMRKLHILPVTDLSSLTTKSASRKVRVTLPLDFGLEFDASTALTDDLFYLHAVAYLRGVMRRFQSSSRHVLVIDGLDDVLVRNVFQYHSLMALINEAMRLNLELHKAGIRAKIIVLCRTDLFERLTGPNKNKVRQDFAFDFNWYHDPRQPNRSALIQLANRRANVRYPGIDLFTTFFDEHIDNTPVREWLLNQTRHTPRDFLQLLKHLQPYSDDGEPMTRNRILSGVRNYSINYFMPELRDELGGHIDAETIEGLMRTFAGLRTREFYLAELEAFAKTKRLLKSEVDLVAVFDLLYDCGAVGQPTTRPSGQKYYYFKYRTRHSSFNPAERIIFHRGLWKALNLA